MRSAYLAERPVLWIDGHSLHGVEGRVGAIYDLKVQSACRRCDVRSAAHLAEDGVLAIEMWLLRIGDEELGLVGVRARVGHRQDPAIVELSGERRISHGRDRMDGREEQTLRVDRISSAKGLPHMLWPPLPEPEGSPVWIMKFLMFRCQRVLS